MKFHSRYVEAQAKAQALRDKENEENKEQIEVYAEQAKLEIRTKTEVVNGVLSAVEYLVHPVSANKDTLFKLSYMYKVSKREIQRVNQFAGEDIFFMKEILIPYNGQQIVLKNKEIDSKTDEDASKSL